MHNLRVALAQTHIEFGSIESNLKKTTEFSSDASRQGASLIVFPELWLHGYDLHHIEDHTIQLPIIQNHLQELSNQLNIHIVGSVVCSSNGLNKNTIVIASPHQHTVMVYDKIHLFRLMHEDQWLSPGNQITVQDMTWGKTGFSICYDLRFPELHRHFFLSDAVMGIIPAEWPQKRIEHWKILLKARAIENQMFYLGCNSVGRTGKEVFGGSSAVISPWGKTLIEGCADKEELLVVDIDLDEVKSVKDHMSIQADRRPDIYGD